ncbi:MAG: lysophospholipid acyltransferase family protein [bacterium]|jgi:1-acyl-sn-glycerol-3-phosphate acyltransferase
MKKNDKIKNILGALFTIYSGIIFIGSMLLFIPPMWAVQFIKEPKRTEVFIYLCRMWMGIFFPLTCIRTKIRGREHFKKGEQYIVACNHNSLVDILLSSPGIPGANKTIAKIELSRIPLFGLIYKRGSILIDRNNDASKKDSYIKMKEVLAEGMHMCIYPEGTRNKTNKPLKSFHDGAFRLAFDTGKSIIPAIITGSKNILPHDKTFYFWPGKMELKFLGPISPLGFANYTEMKEHVFEVMKNELTKSS